LPASPVGLPAVPGWQLATACLGGGQNGESPRGFGGEHRLDPDGHALGHRRVLGAGEDRWHPVELVAELGALTAARQVRLDPGRFARSKHADIETG
jgi:hypothetical protein